MARIRLLARTTCRTGRIVMRPSPYKPRLPGDRKLRPLLFSFHPTRKPLSSISSSFLCTSVLMLIFFVLWFSNSKKEKLERIPFSNKIIRLSLSFFSFYVKLLWMERSFAIFLSKNRFPVLDRRSNISIGYYRSFIDANWETKRVIKRRRDFFNPLELKRAKGVAKDTD